MWGYMGKVPGRGDFITVDVRPDVRDLFFEWCQASLAVSRDQLADRWMDAYLTSPIWHFCAAPGAILDVGLVGTLIPSVDRVGRHFPFLVVREFSGQTLDGWRQPEWASEMEDCILAVLDDGWQEENWQQRLAEVAAPEPSPATMKWPAGEGNLVFPSAGSESDWLQAMLKKDRRNTVWWTQGSAFVEPVTLLTDGLPKIGQFVSMMVGQWPSHGWLEAEFYGEGR
ncbi:MAG: type VI secretion system-associated protein TagF [Pseudomonadales bacterium]|nr:type VI secretion system-associated protein TagF [Pseudomonadales bacterium]